jgi:hypothetical protein
MKFLFLLITIFSISLASPVWAGDGYVDAKGTTWTLDANGYYQATIGGMQYASKDGILRCWDNARQVWVTIQNPNLLTGTLPSPEWTQSADGTFVLQINGRTLTSINGKVTFTTKPLPTGPVAPTYSSNYPAPVYAPDYGSYQNTGEYYDDFHPPGTYYGPKPNNYGSSYHDGYGDDYNSYPDLGGFKSSKARLGVVGGYQNFPSNNGQNFQTSKETTPAPAPAPAPTPAPTKKPTNSTPGKFSDSKGPFH